jgi:hypothetical protein
VILNFAVLQVDLECGKNSIQLQKTSFFILSLFCEIGFFGAKKVKDSLYKVRNFFHSK